MNIAVTSSAYQKVIVWMIVVRRNVNSIAIASFVKIMRSVTKRRMEKTMPNELKPCPVCGGKLDCDVLGHPMASVCRKCEERLLEEHKNDELDNCPFCGADRTLLVHHIALPYFYGAEGVLIRCKQCGARSGWGSIRARLTFDLSKPPLFNEETINNGFNLANAKWNRRSINESTKDN